LDTRPLDALFSVRMVSLFTHKKLLYLSTAAILVQLVLVEGSSFLLVEDEGVWARCGHIL
jgi:hypothetical protein